MSIQVSRATEILNKALDYRAARQDLIASNIANADTPFYKPRDISFEETLRARQADIFHEKNKTLQMAQTDASHLAPQSQASKYMATTFFRDGHMARNDGNSVDIDVETTEMSKNSVMFNALVSAKKKDSAIFNSVIDASAKVS
jgi:flagellar basal-body rod protein FlgB